MEQEKNPRLAFAEKMRQGMSKGTGEKVQEANRNLREDFSRMLFKKRGVAEAQETNRREE
jgi:hypothetical protein